MIVPLAFPLFPLLFFSIGTKGNKREKQYPKEQSLSVCFILSEVFLLLVLQFFVLCSGWHSQYLLTEQRTLSYLAWPL